MNRILFAFLMISTLVSSCFYDSEENLYPNNDCFTESVSFLYDIKPIFEASCFKCHSAAANLGNVNLSTHTAVIKYSVNGSLVGSVKHVAGFVKMPEGAPKMDVCKISKIETWVQAGSPNN